MVTPFRKFYDAIVVGSGAGGSTLAYQLARFNRRVLLVERGSFLKPDEMKDRYRNHIVRANEKPYFVGGDTKFYGSALYRLRESDFNAVRHECGVSPAWPITYNDLAPYYDQAEALYRVHGSPDSDPSEPPRASPYPYPPIPHAPLVSKVVDRLERSGTRVSPIPRGLDVGDQGKCVLCSTCDAYYCPYDAKMDAEIAALRPALATGNVQLATETECLRILTNADGTRVEGALLRRSGSDTLVRANTVAACAGLSDTATLLRRSRTEAHPEGLGNANGCLGRYLAGHSVGIFFVFASLSEIPPTHTKSFAINEYYHGAPDWPYPTGTIQIAGQYPFWEESSRLVRPFTRYIGTRSLLCFYMTEALPSRETGFIFKGDEIHSRRLPLSNAKTFSRLRNLAIGMFRRAGYLVWAPPRENMWHEVGTARLGVDPKESVVDPNCQVHGIGGLFVVDASVLPSAGALNTALTINALALRAGAHISSL